MSTLNYPKPTLYKMPQKNILVLSCMDLRLTDNLVDFLHYDNLHNRYDHVILAGASLACSHKKHLFNEKKTFESLEHWKKMFFHHLQIAMDLHAIQDVYIVEHQNCGAYRALLADKKVDSLSYDEELKLHQKFAEELSKQIKKGESSRHLHVHGFFIDLRGNVELMFTTNKFE